MQKINQIILYIIFFLVAGCTHLENPAQTLMNIDITHTNQDLVLKKLEKVLYTTQNYNRFLQDIKLFHALTFATFYKHHGHFEEAEKYANAASFLYVDLWQDQIDPEQERSPPSTFFLFSLDNVDTYYNAYKRTYTRISSDIKMEETSNDLLCLPDKKYEKNIQMQIDSMINQIDTKENDAITQLCHMRDMISPWETSKSPTYSTFDLKTLFKIYKKELAYYQLRSLQKEEKLSKERMFWAQKLYFIKKYRKENVKLPIVTEMAEYWKMTENVDKIEMIEFCL